MNEIINFSLYVVRLSLIVIIVIVSIIALIRIIVAIIKERIELFKSNEYDIKDRFDETRKKDIEMMLKRQGLYNKILRNKENKKDIL